MNPIQFDLITDFILGTNLVKNSKILPPAGVEAENLYPWILWSMWITRNKMIFDRRSISTQDTAIRAIKDAREWIMAQPGGNNLNQRLPASRSAEVVDKLCFVDGAWHQETKKAGIGWLFLNRESALLQQGSCTIQFVSSPIMAEPIMAEAMTIMEALKVAQEMNWKSLRVNSDSQSLVNLINLGGECKELYGILSDINPISPFSNLCLLFLYHKKPICWWINSQN